MLISEIQGLKYPDEYIIKFFFKEHLDKNHNGNVLELGCGNGNNLMLFYQYRWNILGVDINKDSIESANNNFNSLKNTYNLPNDFKFLNQNMKYFLENYTGLPFNILLIPNSIYYLPYEEIITIFSLIREKKLLKKDSLIFIRTRSIHDYRYGRGKKIGDNTFKLNIDETGEINCINTFFTESEFINILEKKFIFEYKYILSCNYDNVQNGFFITNSDYIIWGKVAGYK